jgi:hypothetical protein
MTCGGSVAAAVGLPQAMFISGLPRPKLRSHSIRETGDLVQVGAVGSPQRSVVRYMRLDSDLIILSADKELSPPDRCRLIKLLKEEVEASRTISRLISEKTGIWLLHRKLEVQS